MIVKLGNFSQAAHFLGYTQSTVTTHIQLLERELNTLLFERYGHQLMLTSAGERLYDYAERILKLTEEAQIELDHFSIPQGPLTIGVPESLCLYRLADLLTEYARIYPQVELKLCVGISGEFRNLLRKNKMDLAFFLEKKVQEPDLISRCLGVEPVVLVASPNHAFASWDNIEVKDLAKQTLIFTDSGSSYRTILEQSLSEANVKPGVVMDLCQIEIIKQFVTSNVGLTILPYVAVEQEIKDGKMVSLPWQGPQFEVNAYLAYHKNKWLSPALKAFLKLIEERFKK